MARARAAMLGTRRGHLADDAGTLPGARTSEADTLRASRLLRCTSYGPGVLSLRCLSAPDWYHRRLRVSIERGERRLDAVCLRVSPAGYSSLSGPELTSSSYRFTWLWWRACMARCTSFSGR